jgi:hypothetical protein
MSGATTRTDLLQEIGAERARQIGEGHAGEDDDQLCQGELARMAAGYALQHAAGTYPDNRTHLTELATAAWPWRHRLRVRRNRASREALIVAAALLIAEIERLERLSGC